MDLLFETANMDYLRDILSVIYTMIFNVYPFNLFVVLFIVDGFEMTKVEFQCVFLSIFVFSFIKNQRLFVFFFAISKMQDENGKLMLPFYG